MSSAPQRVRYEDFEYTERVTIIYTYRCNIRCAHCASEAMRDSHVKMTPDQARQILRASARHGYKWVCWTGGEPLLYRDEILELIRDARSLGLDSGVETNGFWGTSPAAALRLMKQMQQAGLVHVALSCDAFHLEHVAFERILNVVRAARERDLNLITFFIHSGDAARDAAILRLLEEHRIPYEVGDLAPLGYARDLPAGLFGRTDIKDVGDCGELGPLLLPSGEIIGCCNPKVSETSPLFLGRGLDSCDDALGRLARSPVPRVIQRHGFRFLYNELCKDPSFALRHKHYRHYCEFCEDLFADPMTRDATVALCQRTVPAQGGA